MHTPGCISSSHPAEIEVDAVIHRSDNSRVSVCLVEMSFEGCLLSSVELFEIGERVRIQVGGLGYINAEMRWSSEGWSGASFLCECHV